MENLTNVKETDTKETHFENVEYNVELLTELVARFETEYEAATDQVTKSNKMMDLLNAEALLEANTKLLV